MLRHWMSWEECRDTTVTLGVSGHKTYHSELYPAESPPSSAHSSVGGGAVRQDQVTTAHHTTAYAVHEDCNARLRKDEFSAHCVMMDRLMIGVLIVLPDMCFAITYPSRARFVVPLQEWSYHILCGV